MSNIHPLDTRKSQSGEIDAILRNLMGIQGVSAAAIVDNDGFVTHIQRDSEINTDAIGASVQVVFGAAARAAQHVGHHATNMVICENAEGFILSTPVEAGFMLALVTQRDALLGRVRFELKETIPVLKKLFSHYLTH
ncbi:roadblock/LC7 domain-containing protein [Methylomonas rivi]|uniref:Roadblock/LC7 domain-containing protein n=1 Tax=Methylomonas rivi TaxID=2952226 RepID=A0ABT1U2P6_9GAMM|nr:roadblock/LC7 domain-containing protein [Methylomonas sp. WSC-6]MBS4050806.1 roadblock/LC7 domain-containing protein [Methylomonas sp.]MCQ8128117.1 roadblock/LC7 domain-containing protein [Methylomonas sp. WSC-6]